MTSTITRKTFAFVLAAAVSLTLSFGAYTPKANAATVEELLALIAQLQAQLAALQGGNNQGGNTSGTAQTTSTYVHHPTIDYEFTRNLYLGSKGEDVKMLQKVLNLDPDTQVATTGPGSPGNETEYFGGKTKAAVAKFQMKNGITPALGYFYPKTRAEMNKKRVVVVNNDNNNSNDNDNQDNNTVTGDKLVVEGTAADDMLVGPSQTVVVSKLVLKAGDEDVKVKNVEVKYTGTADESKVLDKVVLLDSAMLELDTDSLNSNDKAKLRADKVVKDGESTTLYVAMRTKAFTSGDSQNALTGTLKVTAVTTDGADVEGTPVMGASVEFHSGVTVDKFDAQITQEKTGTVKIGEEAVKIATVNIENKSTSDDPETVKSIKLTRTGTAGDNALDNVEIKVDGKTYKASQDDKDYTFDFGDGIKLAETGDDMDFAVYADIEDDSTKTFGFDVKDVVVVDEDGVILSDTDSGDSAGAGEWTYSATVTIALSEISISKTTDVQSKKVAAGEKAAELASFKAEVTGKNVTGDLQITVKISGASGADTSDIDLENLALYKKDGGRVSDKEDTAFATSTDGTTYVVTLDDVEFKAGDDPVDYVIKADINKDAPTNTKYEVTQIKYVSIEDTDGEDISDVTETIASPAQIEVEAAAIAVSVENADDTDVNSDTDNVVVAKIKLDADNSGDDVKVSQIKLAFALENLKEVTKVTVTSTSTAAAVATTTLDGTTTVLTTVSGSASTTAQIAAGIAADVNAVSGYSAVANGSVVTITADNAGEKVDTTVVGNNGLAFKVETSVQGSGADLNDVRQCELFDGTNSVSDKQTAASTVTYSTDITVTKDTEKTLTVQCDLGSDFNNGNTVKVTGVSFDAKGVVTDKKLDANFTTSASVTVTDGSAEFALTSDDVNDPKVVKDTDNAVVLGQYEFKAKDAELTIDDITVTFTNNVTSTIDGKVDVYINGSKEGSETPTDVALSQVKYTNLGKKVAKDDTVTVEFRADMKAAGTVEITSVSMTTEEGVSVPPENNNGPNVKIVTSLPVVTKVDVDSSNLETANDVTLFAYKVKAVGGDVELGKAVLKVDSTNITFANARVKVYDNASMTGSAKLDQAASTGNSSAVLSGSATSASERVLADLSSLTVPENDTYWVFLVADTTATQDSRSVRVTLEDTAYTEPTAANPYTTGAGMFFDDSTSNNGTWNSGTDLDGSLLINGDMKSLLKRD